MKKIKRFQNKYILVTGASSGIGFQVARDFLAEGAYVGAQYRKNRKEAKRLLKYAKGSRCRLFQADFSFSQEVEKLWKEFAFWTKGRISILINNAGEVGKPLSLNKLTETAWDHVFQVNVKAPFLLTRKAMRVMIKNRFGRIINISSIGVKFGGGKETVHYSASKAALEAITKSFAKAGAPYNVLVNVIRPGVTKSPFHKKVGRMDLSARISKIPLKRLAKPSEISSIVIFLASRDNTYITNSIIDIAGGE